LKFFYLIKKEPTSGQLVFTDKRIVMYCNLVIKSCHSGFVTDVMIVIGQSA
jgi:hypothetical protein